MSAKTLRARQMHRASLYSSDNQIMLFVHQRDYQTNATKIAKCSFSIYQNNSTKVIKHIKIIHVGVKFELFNKRNNSSKS